MLNKCFFVGNIGKDPVFKETANSCYLKFSLGVQSGFGDKKQTNWANITIWAKRAEALNKILHKGSKILVECEYQLNTWEKDGAKQYITDFNASNVILLDSKPKNKDEVDFHKEITW